MPRRIAVGVLVFLGILGTGLVVTWIMRTRDAASRLTCQSNLKQIAIAVHAFESVQKHLPPGTQSHPNLPIEKRLSWLAAISPHLGSSRFVFDPNSPWDDKPNNWPSALKDGRFESIHERPFLMCPENADRSVVSRIGVSHYVGIAGVGADAAELPQGDKRCGAFGYDRKITIKDIADGTGTTLLVAETALDNGPWTAGGPPTVRGLEPEKTYLGQFGQFSSLHRGRYVLWENLSTNVAFADASVRPIASTMSPAVLEALATIAGGEKVELPDE